MKKSRYDSGKQRQLQEVSVFIGILRMVFVRGAKKFMIKGVGNLPKICSVGDVFFIVV
jgi:hypothetical protein